MRVLVLLCVLFAFAEAAKPKTDKVAKWFAKLTSDFDKACRQPSNEVCQKLVNSLPTFDSVCSGNYDWTATRDVHNDMCRGIKDKKQRKANKKPCAVLRSAWKLAKKAAKHCSKGSDKATTANYATTPAKPEATTTMEIPEEALPYGVYNVSFPNYTLAGDLVLINETWEEFKQRAARFASLIPTAQGRKKRQAIADPAKLWPGGVVPWAIELPDLAYCFFTIIDAMAYIESVSCIDFVLATDPSKNRIVFNDNKGPGVCASPVGNYNVTGQPLYLGAGCCDFGIIVHELMHSLGFFHEQQRCNRDEYVTIHYENIDERHWHNFEPICPPTSTDLCVFGYDYDSLMHYGPYEFTNNTKPTTTPNDPGATLMTASDRDELSKTDIMELNLLYGCEEAPNCACVDGNMLCAPCTGGTAECVQYDDGSFCASANGCKERCSDENHQNADGFMCRPKAHKPTERECVCLYDCVEGSVCCDPHYRTWDGLKHDYQGTCKHTVLRPCYTTDYFPTFVISMNSARLFAYDNGLSWPLHSFIKVIDWDLDIVASLGWFGYWPGFYLYSGVEPNRTAEKLELPKVLVFEDKPKPGWVKLFADPTHRFFLYAEFSFGVSVRIGSSARSIQINIPNHPDLIGNTCGTLGTWDGDVTNDLTARNGTVYQPDPQPFQTAFGTQQIDMQWAFGDSWCESPDEIFTVERENEIDAATRTALADCAAPGPKQQLIDFLCAPLLDASPCDEQNATDYYNDCIVDSCVAGTEEGQYMASCSAIMAYNAACKEELECADYGKNATCSPSEVTAATSDLTAFTFTPDAQAWHQSLLIVAIFGVTAADVKVLITIRGGPTLDEFWHWNPGKADFAETSQSYIGKDRIDFPSFCAFMQCYHHGDNITAASLGDMGVKEYTPSALTWPNFIYPYGVGQLTIDFCKTLHHTRDLKGYEDDPRYPYHQPPPEPIPTDGFDIFN